MKTFLNRTLALALLSASIAGSAAAETKPCNDQQSATQSTKAEKHSKKAKDAKTKQQQPDNSFYAIFG